MTSPIPTSDTAFPSHMLALAESVCAEFYRLYPDTDERYGGRGRAYCAHDNAYLAAWIVSAVELGSPATLARDVGWLAELLAARDFPMDRFVRDLELVADAVVADGLAPAAAVESIVRPVADAILAGQLTALATPPEAMAPYVEALVRPDPRGARAVVEAMVGAGQPARAIYMDVLGPALVEVGRRWQLAQITVAHEHLATATTKMIMARLAPLVGKPPPIGRRIVLACSPGELHGVGLRMVADFLEGDGWEVLELGADTPTEDLLSIVSSERPDAVGISTALSPHLADAATTVARLKALDPAPYVLVGGAAYGNDPALAKRVGADGYAADAATTSTLLRDRFEA